MFMNALGAVMLSVDELVHDRERILFVITPIFFINGGHIFLGMS
jgi:hypothetical protein